MGDCKRRDHRDQRPESSGTESPDTAGRAGDRCRRGCAGSPAPRTGARYGASGDRAGPGPGRPKTGTRSPRGRKESKHRGGLLAQPCQSGADREMRPIRLDWILEEDVEQPLLPDELGLLRQRRTRHMGEGVLQESKDRSEGNDTRVAATRTSAIRRPFPGAPQTPKSRASRRRRAAARPSEVQVAQLAQRNE